MVSGPAMHPNSLVPLLLVSLMGSVAVGAVDVPSPPILTWDTVAQQIDLPWNGTQATAVYRCTNTTAAPVRLIVTSDCGCLTTTPDPNPLPAGATGTLTVTLPIGFRSGTVTKGIVVTTDPPGTGPAHLQITATIPVLATIRPGFLHWRQGDPADIQTATVTLAPDLPVRITGIKSSGSVLNAVWEPAADGRGGFVRVTPRGTDLPWNGSVVVLTDVGRDVVIFCRCIAPDPVPAPVGSR